MHDCNDAEAKQQITQLLGVSATSSQYQQPMHTHPKHANHNAWSIKEAHRLWQQSQSTQGTLVERYLANRGLILPIPDCIRFLPCYKYAQNKQYPVMLAAITHPVSGEFMGVLRTYLLPDGSGKAQVSSPKKILGNCRGGAVQFAPAQNRLIIGEGIETCLSVQQNTEYPVWAALSVHNLTVITLPALPLAQHVTVIADNDKTGAGQKAAQTAAHRWLLQGRTVDIATPPPSVNDFNDLLVGEPHD